MSQTRCVAAKRLGWLVLALCLASSLLGGCAAKRMQAGDGAQTWTAFQAAQAKLRSRPDNFSLNATLNLFQEKRSARTVLRIWGQRDVALRMDMQAGVGAPLAYMAEDSAGLLMVSPQDGRAYMLTDREQGLQPLGIDLPFTLMDLASLFTSSLSNMVPSQYERVSEDTSRLTYHFNQRSMVRTLTVDPQGRPLEMTGGSDTPWKLSFVSHSEAGLPEQVTIEVPSQQQSASFRVRELIYRTEPWPANALTLDIPPGTTVQRLGPGERVPLL